MKPETRKFLNAVNRGKTEFGMEGIIDLCDEWITEGWGLDRVDGPTAPMYAAALFNEASDQEGCVKRGESVVSYLKDLRKLAFEILRLEGHTPEA